MSNNDVIHVVTDKDSDIWGPYSKEQAEMKALRLREAHGWQVRVERWPKSRFKQYEELVRIALEKK